MKGKISKMKNMEDELVLPVTTVEAVYMEDGKTLNDEIDDINSFLDNLENEKATRQEVDVERERIDNISSSLDNNVQQVTSLNKEECYISRGNISPKMLIKKDLDYYIYTEKPSNSDEFICFKLGEGSTYGTTNTSVGVNYEFLRCINVNHILNFELMKKTTKTKSSNVEWSYIDINYSNDNGYLSTIQFLKPSTKVANAYLEYEITTPKGVLETDILIFKSNASSSNINIYVDDEMVCEGVSFVGDSIIDRMTIPLKSSGKHIIKIETMTASYFYIAGVSLVKLKDYKGYDVDGYIELPSQLNHYVKVTGAMDYAIYDKDIEMWCGSYHGGETRTSIKILVDGKVTSLLNNEFVIGNTIEIIQETDINNKLTTFSRQIFSHNGERELQVILKGAMNVSTLYVNMSTTSDTFKKIIYPINELIDDNGKLYLDSGCNLIIQENETNNLRAITVLNNNKLSRTQPMIKNTVDTYNKVYNANIEENNGIKYMGGSYRVIHIFD